MEALDRWRDFYVMIGTASGVIVGAAFVVASLATSMKEREMGMRGFITPTVVHLSSVLFGSAILAVPTLTRWRSSSCSAPADWAEWCTASSLPRGSGPWSSIASIAPFMGVAPVLAYGLLAVAALMACRPGWPVFETLAVALVALLIVGMRNAWDMATFMIMRNPAP